MMGVFLMKKLIYSLFFYAALTTPYATATDATLRINHITKFELMYDDGAQPENLIIDIDQDSLQEKRFLQNRYEETALSVSIKQLCSGIPPHIPHQNSLAFLNTYLECYLALCQATLMQDLEDMELLLSLGVNPNLLFVQDHNHQATRSYMLADCVINYMPEGENKKYGRFILYQTNLFILNWVGRTSESLYKQIEDGTHVSPFLYPLVWAVQNNFVQGVELLLKYGAEPNIATHKRFSIPLITQAIQQSPVIQQLLISYEADLSLLPYYCDTNNSTNSYEQKKHHLTNQASAQHEQQQ